MTTARRIASSTRPRTGFDLTAQHFAELIDAILVAQRSRERRIQLIRYYVRRALAVGFKAGRDNDGHA